MSGTVGSLIAVLDHALVTVGGWSKVYTGTNKAAYRAPVGGSARHYLRVDDTNALFARLVGYEDMTDVDTGTGPFPTNTQFAGGLYLVKSSASGAAARTWIITVSDRLFHLWNVNSTDVPTDATAVANGFGMCFGEYKSVTTGDAYNSVLIASTSSSATSGEAMATQAAIGSVNSGHYSPRSYTQVSGAVAVGKMGDLIHGSSGAMGTTHTYSYPNPSDGGIYLAPIRLHQGFALVGALPGMWQLLHTTSAMNVLDVFEGSGALAGRTFIYLKVDASGAYVLETSDTWDD